MLVFRDPVGHSASEADAHGNAFDRVNAFQEGYERGPKRCKEYAEGKRPTPTEMNFGSSTDRAQGGNYPYDPVDGTDGTTRPGAPDAFAADLNGYFATKSAAAGLDFTKVAKLEPYQVGSAAGGAAGGASLPRCGTRQLTTDEATQDVAYCAADNSVLYDDDFLRSVHQEIGDFGVALLLAFQFAVDGQVHAGIDPTSDDAQLQQSCLTGSWAASVYRRGLEAQGSPTDALTLSPGDLDESVQAFLAFSQSPDEMGRLDAFSRVKHFRAGFFGGEAACRLGAS